MRWSSLQNSGAKFFLNSTPKLLLNQFILTELLQKQKVVAFLKHGVHNQIRLPTLIFFFIKVEALSTVNAMNCCVALTWLNIIAIFIQK